MIKIFMSVRNRLAITKKAIEALERHSAIGHEIYIFDNCTNYKIREHFEYMFNLYKCGLIAQCAFNTDISTFGAFSKAIAFNDFGHHHMQDPNWQTYDFLMVLDNDIIVLPGWDVTLKKAWKDVRASNFKDQIKIISQRPGGIKSAQLISNVEFSGFDAVLGKLGGGGCWSISPRFFHEVGFLDVKRLIGHNKRFDSEYWNLLERANKGRAYTLGLNTKLVIHCGRIAGSICNTLTNYRGDKNKLERIKFEEAEEKIDKMSFDEFMKFIRDKKNLAGDW